MVLAFAGDSTITRLPSISVFLDSSVKPPSAGFFRDTGSQNVFELQSNEQSWQFSKFLMHIRKNTPLIDRKSPVLTLTMRHPARTRSKGHRL